MNKFLKENYCNLATVCSNGSPWNTPLFFVNNNKLLYWWSPIETVHSKNIINNPNVFITIYNSTTPIGKGNGTCLYLQCLAGLVADDTEKQNAIKLYNSKVGNIEFYLNDKNTSEDAPTRIYKAEILRAWTNADGQQDGYYIDIRNNISLGF